MSTLHIFLYILSMIIVGVGLYFMVLNDGGRITRRDVFYMAFFVLIAPVSLAGILLLFAVLGFFGGLGYIHERYGIAISLSKITDPIDRWLDGDIKVPGRKGEDK